MGTVYIKSKSKTIAYCTLNTETFEYKKFPKVGRNLSDIEKALNNVIGTIVFEHNKFGIYGVVKDRNGIPHITWMLQKSIDSNEEYKSKFIKIKGSVIDVSDYSDEIFIKQPNKVFHKSPAFVLDSDWKNIGRDRFREYIGLKEPDIQSDDILNEDDMMEDVELDETTFEDNIGNNDIIDDSNEHDVDPLQKYEEWLDKKLDSYYVSRQEREELAKREAELDVLSKKALQIINSTSENNNDTILDVINVSDEPKVNNINSNYFIYEIMLKVLKQEDSISIPLDFYKSLSVLLRKNLYMNMSFTKYTALVDIKINGNTDVNNIFGAVDYDENLEYIRLTVLKEYNSTKVQDKELLLYEMQYSKWKREKSITVNT